MQNSFFDALNEHRDIAALIEELRQAREEIRELKDKLAQERVCLEDETQGGQHF